MRMPGFRSGFRRLLRRMLGVHSDNHVGRCCLRSESRPGYSRTPNHWRSGSTSPEPRAPTAVAVAAAAPTAARLPTGRSRPDRFGLPDLAHRGSDSSPSRRPYPNSGPIDPPGTSDSWARASGSRAPRDRLPTPGRTTPTPQSPAPLRTALQTPSVKDFPSTRSIASTDFAKPLVVSAAVPKLPRLCGQSTDSRG